MSLKERLKSVDAHSSVSKEFRVYTVQGAVLSVVTVLAIIYLVISEARFNFQVTLQESVHVNATSSRGLEMEFDISLPSVPCSKLQIDAADPQGQSQSLHLDAEHHVWKHRIKMTPDGRRTLIGSRTKLELGSTLKNERDLIDVVEEEGKIKEEPDKEVEAEVEEKCGSCYGAGEEDECCNTCEDVRRAYKRRGWVLRVDASNVVQCINEGEPDSQEGEGCNVHGRVALSTAGGNLHLAPGREAAAGGMTILEALIQSFQEWNVSHHIHKIRFGPEYPAAIYQLDAEKRTIEDTYGMYQYYFQVSFGELV
jgi:endoplasmic reticulum-Golgi intermediate compartment protein 3